MLAARLSKSRYVICKDGSIHTLYGIACPASHGSYMGRRNRTIQ